MLAMNAVGRANATASDLIVEILLFLCSYAPLFLILAGITTQIVSPR